MATSLYIHNLYTYSTILNNKNVYLKKNSWTPAWLDPSRSTMAHQPLLRRAPPTRLNPSKPGRSPSRRPTSSTVANSSSSRSQTTVRQHCPVRSATVLQVSRQRQNALLHKKCTKNVEFFNGFRQIEMKFLFLIYKQNVVKDIPNRNYLYKRYSRTALLTCHLCHPLF